MMDDLDFYEEYILKLPDNQQEAFFKEVPDFMAEYPLWSGDIQILKDKFRWIMRETKKNEKTKAKKMDTNK